MSGWTFLREFVRDPTSLGAVAPSGEALARLEIDAADVHPDHVVVELGAGTGPMTAALLAQHPALALLVLEPNPALAAALRARFPHARVETSYAQELPERLQVWGHSGVDRVISSLPWAIWPVTLQNEILDAIFTVLRPNARMVTFQYVHSQFLPAARRFHGVLESRFASVQRTEIAWANVPPAFVYVLDGPRV